MTMTTPDFTLPTRKPGHVTIRNRWFAVRLNYRVLGMCLLTIGLLALLTI